MTRRHHGIAFASVLCAVAACSSDESRPRATLEAPLQISDSHAQGVVDELARFPTLGAVVSKTIILEKRSDGFRASLASKLTGTIPSDARGALRIGIRDRRNIWIEIIADDLVAAKGVALGNAVVFVGAARDTDVLHVAESARIEEVRILRTPAAPTMASYTLVIGPGLETVRARDGRIEAVDAGGYVHLASAPIFALDAKQQRRDLAVSVERVGSSWRVHTLLDSGGLVYPIAVDPGWSATGTMKSPRYRPTVTVLPSGKVLAVGGGASSITDFVSSAEIYDPATNTWTSISSMKEARRDHAAVLLSGGKVLIAGGRNATPRLSTVEIFDPASGTWSSKAAMNSPRGTPGGAAFGADSAVVVGGNDPIGSGKPAEFYNAGSDTWTSTPFASSLPIERDYPGVTVLASGKAFFTGGMNGFSAIDTGDIYDGPTNTWTPVGKMFLARVFHTATRLSDGKVLVVGGFNTSYGFPGGGGGYNQTTTFDPSTGGWASACCTANRALHNAMLLPDGKVLIAGGSNGSATSYLSSAEMFDPSKGTSTSAPSLATGRYGAGAVPLGTTRLLLVGGYGSAGVLSGCEIYDTGTSPKLGLGAACLAASECTSSFCVDGVCCDKICAGDCEACTAASKGSGTDGTCGVASADTDPRSKCPSDPGYPTSCKSDGMCDGSGACRTFAKASVACGATTCVAGKVSGKLCNGAGACVSGTDTPCDPYRCDAVGTACLTKCTTDGDCITDYRCSAGACVPKGVVKKNGLPCADASECASGFCADATCCDTACKQQCGACDIKGAEGTCTAVLGPPPASRPPCGDPTDPCSGRCNGVDKDKCGFASAGTTCGGSCADGSLTSSACDGKGGCAPSAPTSCNGFVCEDKTKCKSACVSDADCIAGNQCLDGACVAPTAASEAKSGCGCHTPANDAADPRALALAFALTFIVRLRRRRRSERRSP